MDKRLIYLISFMAVMLVIYYLHTIAIDKVESHYKTIIALQDRTDDSLKWELSRQKKDTDKWIARYDSVRKNLKSPETIYITAKSKYDAKITYLNSLSSDDHLLYISTWLPKEDSVRRRHGYSLSFVTDSHD